MRIRLFIVVLLFLPIVFLFGFDIYLAKYDQHSKYLSQLKDGLLSSTDAGNPNSDKISTIISSIDDGNFLRAGECMRLGMNAGDWCKIDNDNTLSKNITNIDILKGGYKESADDYIKDFRENIIKKRGGYVREPIFDFDYNFISYNSPDIWLKFNQKITSKRYSYFKPNQVGTYSNLNDNIDGSYGPDINYSSVAPIAGGRVRILAISDSFGAGHGLMSMDDTWGRELERQLNQIEDRYEVVVLARNGAGYQEFLRWAQEGYVEALDPDLVLLSYFDNDFNLLFDFGKERTGDRYGGLELNGLDKELVFYLRCFQLDDDLIGSSFKKLNKIFPSIYRFYKFSRCGEGLSRLDSTNLIDRVGVVGSYAEIDSLIKVPIFLYELKKVHAKDEQKIEILDEINKNGLHFINNPKGMRPMKDDMCFIGFINKLENCEKYIANKYNGHFNSYFNKGEIRSEVTVIKNRIDLAVAESKGNRDNFLRINKSEAIIVDYLPNTLFVSNTSKSSSNVGFFYGEGYGYGRSSENFCVPFDRKGVVLNFNRYLTEGKEIKISSEFQGSGLGLVSRGYDEQGKVIYGKAFELKPGSSVSFIGSESVRGVVLLSNNKNCSSKDIDINDEFLLQVEIL